MAFSKKCNVNVKKAIIAIGKFSGMKVGYDLIKATYAVENLGCTSGFDTFMKELNKQENRIVSFNKYDEKELFMEYDGYKIESTQDNGMEHYDTMVGVAYFNHAEEIEKWENFYTSQKVFDLGFDLPARNLSSYRVKQLKVEHFNLTCEVCGFVGSKFSYHEKLLNIHHIKTVNDGGRDRLDNFACLCEDCHKAVHGLGFTNIKAIEKYNTPREYFDIEVLPKLKQIVQIAKVA